MQLARLKAVEFWLPGQDITPWFFMSWEDFKRKYEGDIELQLPVPTSVLSVIDPDALAILLQTYSKMP